VQGRAEELSAQFPDVEAGEIVKAIARAGLEIHAGQDLFTITSSDPDEFGPLVIQMAHDQLARMTDAKHDTKHVENQTEPEPDVDDDA